MTPTVRYCTTAAILVLAGAAYTAWGTEQMLELDIQAGEPFGDVMARSSLKSKTNVLVDMQNVNFPPLDDWNGDRYQVRLRGGNDQSALIPWTPTGGTIWMTAGMVGEVSLNYEDLNLDAIAGIYASIMAMDPVPSEIVSCYHNSLPAEMLAAERRQSEEGTCEDTIVLPDRQSDVELRAALRGVHDKDTPFTLNMGQWWLGNGNLLMMKVRPLPNEGFSFSIVVNEFYRAGMSRLIAPCFDQQAIFPERIVFTQDQSAQILHGLVAIMYPPVLDGQPLTDEIQIQNIDWTRKQDEFWNDPQMRGTFCATVLRLQDKVGYTGPQPPLR